MPRGAMREMMETYKPHILTRRRQLLEDCVRDLRLNNDHIHIVEQEMRQAIKVSLAPSGIRQRNYKATLLLLHCTLELCVAHSRECFKPKNVAYFIQSVSFFFVVVDGTKCRRISSFQCQMFSDICQSFAKRQRRGQVFIPGFRRNQF